MVSQEGDASKSLNKTTICFFCHEKNNLKTQINDLKTQINDLKTQIKLETTLPQLEAKFSYINTEINNNQGKLEVTTEDLGTKKGELKEAEARYIKLNEQAELLQEKESELITIKGELSIKERQLNEVLKELDNKLPQKTELASELHQLTLNKNQLQIDKNELETQVHQLQIEAKKLEKVETELAIKENELLNKKAELEKVLKELTTSEIKKQEYDKCISDLEILRVTYDNLFKEKQTYEEKIQKLKPQIESLELQKQQIIQVIKENENKYQEMERLKSQIRQLLAEIREYQGVKTDLQQDINKLLGIKDNLHKQIAEFQEEVKRLEDKIKQLKGEIDAIENSGENALKALKTPLWNNLPDSVKNLTEEEFLVKFQEFLQTKGLNFSERVVKAFHTSLKVQDISPIVILAGISGTGKSELPQRYAEFLGACSLVLPVQPRWDSPQDLQGFYNYMEKKYKPTDLMRGLYQAQDRNMNGRLVIVLLDEMNLARVEYYFSDFLSKLESRRSHNVYLDLDVGSLSLPETDRKIQIPNQFLFVGTMNEDETTQSLSDKVLDRANVLTFGKPNELTLRKDNQNKQNNEFPRDYVSYSQFIEWRQKLVPDSKLVEKIKTYINKANIIMDGLGHPFAHRVYQAIILYVINYPEVISGNEEALKIALSDQFGQKILPKLRGIMVDDYQDDLASFETIIRDLGDNSLIIAFEKAKAGSYGQFNWKGLVYEDT